MKKKNFGSFTKYLAVGEDYLKLFCKQADFIVFFLLKWTTLTQFENFKVVFSKVSNNHFLKTFRLQLLRLKASTDQFYLPSIIIVRQSFVLILIMNDNLLKVILKYFPNTTHHTHVLPMKHHKLSSVFILLAKIL